MNDHELSEIRARAERTLVCSAKDIPALLKHIDEQQGEIERLKRDIGYLAAEEECRCITQR